MPKLTIKLNLTDDDLDAITKLQSNNENFDICVLRLLRERIGTESIEINLTEQRIKTLVDQHLKWVLDNIFTPLNDDVVLLREQMKFVRESQDTFKKYLLEHTHHNK